jgi:hypothetical protein
MPDDQHTIRNQDVDLLPRSDNSTDLSVCLIHQRTSSLPTGPLAFGYDMRFIVRLGKDQSVFFDCETHTISNFKTCGFKHGRLKEYPGIPGLFAGPNITD